MDIANLPLLIQKMTVSHKSINVPEGGRWGAEQRQDTVGMTVGVYEKCFVHATTPDPAVVHWVTQLQNILAQSYTEQAYYDFKQGFAGLDDHKQFDDDNLVKILQTCVGIANLRKGARGYVLVGVAEKGQTAQRVRELYGVEARPHERFFIVGVEHEAIEMGKDLDQFFHFIIERVRASDLCKELREYAARHLKFVRYFDKTVVVFEVQGQDDPSH